MHFLSRWCVCEHVCVCVCVCLNMCVCVTGFKPTVRTIKHVAAMYDFHLINFSDFCLAGSVLASHVFIEA